MSLLMLVFSDLADPGAADRQLHHRGVRLARGVLGGDHRRAAGVRAARVSLEGDAAGRASRRQFVRQRLGRLQDAVVDRNFLGLMLIGGFGIASFFVYLSNSSFIMIDHYGMSPSVYSLFFSMNAVSFFGVSQMSGMDDGKIRPAAGRADRGVRICRRDGRHVCCHGVRLKSLAFMAVALFVGYGFLGLVIPTTSVLAMEDHGEIAGTASALMGTLHMVTGVAAMAVSGFFADGMPMPMVTAIASCAAIALVLTLVTLKPAQGGGGRSAGGITRQMSGKEIGNARPSLFSGAYVWAGWIPADRCGDRNPPAVRRLRGAVPSARNPAPYRSRPSIS